MKKEVGGRESLGGGLVSTILEDRILVKMMKSEGREREDDGQSFLQRSIALELIELLLRFAWCYVASIDIKWRC